MKHREAEFLSRLEEEAARRKWTKKRKLRISLDNVWKAFRQVPNRNPVGEYEPLVLLQQLTALEGNGHITQFKQYTRESPPLPTGIWLLPTALPDPIPPAMPNWHPDIYWLADEWPTATPKQRAAYEAVNAWLLSGRCLDHVPLRERALEIFGLFGSEEDFPMPEKTLDSLKSGPLFGDPKVLHQIIRALTTHPPALPEQFVEELGGGYYQRIDPGDILLVVENSATWWSIVHSLPPNHRLGYVAWGLGATFRASINTISSKHGVTEVRYFGDLDLSGIRIPDAAARTARKKGLPPVYPAERLYDALLRRGKAIAGKEPPASPDEASSLTSWLPAQQRQGAQQLLLKGERLAQEWVGYRYLTTDNTWYADVR